LGGITNDNPALNGAVSSRILTQAVEEFFLELLPDGRSLRLRLRLAQRGGRKVGSRFIDQRAEVVATYMLNNTATP